MNIHTRIELPIAHPMRKQAHRSGREFLASAG